MVFWFRRFARPDPEGGYELVAGHRRHRASELAEKRTMPVIVRDLDDDAATIIMVDSNLQRESLLPSERAFAYKMKLEAMKHQGARGDLTSSQLGTKLRADELLAQQAGSSRNQVQALYPPDGADSPNCWIWSMKRKSPSIRLMSCPFSKKKNSGICWTRWTANRLPPLSPRLSDSRNTAGGTSDPRYDARHHG